MTNSNKFIPDKIIEQTKNKRLPYLQDKGQRHKSIINIILTGEILESFPEISGISQVFEQTSSH